MRVLHCPTHVGGHGWEISRAERDLGIISDVVVFESNWFGYPDDVNLHLERYSLPVKMLKVFEFFVEAVHKYDIFHFNFGRSILDYPYWINHFDLPLLKKMGKKIVVTYQGCDARLKSYCLENFEVSACKECIFTTCESYDSKKIERIKRVSKYADKIFVLCPDLMYHFSAAEFMPFAINHRLWMPEKTGGRHNAGKIKILHAPSSRSIKGTHYILDACKKLNENGYSVDLQLIENIPNNQVKEYYSRSNIVVDQLLGGWYGRFSVEAMALEKPVLCFLREKDSAFVPFKDSVPIIKTTKDTLYKDLITLILDPKLRKKIGMDGRSFVKQIHDSRTIAKRLIESYESIM